jgi:hypothetical protein
MHILKNIAQLVRIRILTAKNISTNLMQETYLISCHARPSVFSTVNVVSLNNDGKYLKTTKIRKLNIKDSPSIRYQIWWLGMERKGNGTVAIVTFI